MPIPPHEKVTIPDGLDYDIQALAKKYHNPKLVKCDHVVKVWSDGEITTEKGGDLYGERSLHQFKPPATTENFVFPEECENIVKNGRAYQFAIVTSEQAMIIRTAILRKAASIMLERSNYGF